WISVLLVWSRCLLHTVSRCGRTCRGRRNCRNMNGERRYLS
ncbi:FIG01046809: hypothetical protein, partial [Salmonella enterica subsp. enterica serovar Rissen]